jgi:hypothetical protein
MQPAHPDSTGATVMYQIIVTYSEITRQTFDNIPSDKVPWLIGVLLKETDATDIAIARQPAQEPAQ